MEKKTFQTTNQMNNILMIFPHSKNIPVLSQSNQSFTQFDVSSWDKRSGFAIRLPQNPHRGSYRKTAMEKDVKTQ
jgi:hypothetical protein